MRIARGLEGGEQFGYLIRAASFHRDIDGGFSQVYAVVGAIVRGLDDICPVVSENSGQAM